MATVKHYRSRDGAHTFKFRVEPNGSHIDIYVDGRPSFNGQDPSPPKTHLFDSGRICFIAGREPRDQRRAETLAADWAEFFLRYRQTGAVES